MENNNPEENNDQNLKLPIEDERYRVAGLNAFSFSKWSKDNLPKQPARFKVGDVVAVTIITEITKVYEDCDGTPLYAFDKFTGWPDDGSIRPATDEELNSF